MLLRANKILAVIMLLSGNLMAQTGYMGKINEVSLDLFNLGLYKTLSFQDKIMVGQNTAIGVNFSLLSASRDYTIPGTSNSQFSQTDVPAHLDFTAKGFGLNIYKNLSVTGMPLPFGWYYYTGFDYYNGNVNSSYSMKHKYLGEDPFGTAIYGDVNYNINGVKYNGVGIKSGYGKDLYLYHNLTLDICYEAGFLFNFYSNPSDNEFAGLQKFPTTDLFIHRLLPADDIFLNYIDAKPHSVGFTTSFIYTLKVRVGYIF